MAPQFESPPVKNSLGQINKGDWRRIILLLCILDIGVSGLFVLRRSVRRK